MRGEDVVEKIRQTWTKYMYVELEQGSASETPVSADTKALMVIDKKLRAPGVGAKSQAAFTFYTVSTVTLSSSHVCTCISKNKTRKKIDYYVVV